MKKHIGIVLKKKRSNKDCYFIFDWYEGKITAFFSQGDLIQGSLISYFVTKKRSGFFIESIELIDALFDLARTDILFLHHVLELCCYFLPSCLVAPKSFDLLLILFSSIDMVKTVARKKIFIFKLLVSFGFYSQYEPLSTFVFSMLNTESIDRLADSYLHLEIERDLDQWLSSCVGAHPYFTDFKTAHFLKTIRLK